MYCVMYWLYSLLFACAAAYFHPSIAQPLELVDFEMLDTRENIENNRYDIAATQGGMRSNLPLLSRGERETRVQSLAARSHFDQLIDGEVQPTCRELRKMWRMARKIHTKALRTNEIPIKLHPFNTFESDRFRNVRRFRGGKKQKSRGRVIENKQKGDKEQNMYGVVSLSPGETEKRPMDALRAPKNPLGAVYNELREEDGLPPRSTNKPTKPVWANGIRYMPAGGLNPPSAFDNLHSKLREDKGLKPIRKEKEKTNNSWGSVKYFQGAPRKPSPLDRLRDSLKQSEGGSNPRPNYRGSSSRPNYRDDSSSRLNYRDDSSSSISSGSVQTAGIVDKPGRARANRKHLRRRQNSRRKISALEEDLLRSFRRNSDKARKADKKKNLRKKYESQFLKNLMMKGK